MFKMCYLFELHNSYNAYTKVFRVHIIDNLLCVIFGLNCYTNEYINEKSLCFTTLNSAGKPSIYLLFSFREGGIKKYSIMTAFI